MGGVQARPMAIIVSSRLAEVQNDNMAPMFIFDVTLPAVVGEFLRTGDKFLEGQFAINPKMSVDITQPTQLGWITLKPDFPRFGPKTNLGIVAETGDGCVIIATPTKEITATASELITLATKYQVYSQEGLTIPVGKPYSPTGYGHIIVYNVNNACVRPLTLLECWLVSGGDDELFTKATDEYQKITILGTTTPEVQLFTSELALGLLESEGSGSFTVGGYPTSVGGETQKYSACTNQIRHKERVLYDLISCPQNKVLESGRGRPVRFVGGMRNLSLVYLGRIRMFPGDMEGKVPHLPVTGELCSFTARVPITKTSHMCHLGIPRRGPRTTDNTPTGNRLEMISRFFTRIARRGQKPADGPTLDFNPRRERYIQHLVEHPSFQALRASEEDFRQIAGDVGEADKKRVYVRYDENAELYLAGCYNGHTVYVERSPELQPIRRPNAYAHATNWESAVKILREGLRAMARKDMHFVPTHMNLRQEAYIRPSAKKTHIITFGGVMCQASGVASYELDNEVIVPRGINGLLHPCTITGLFSNTNMGSRSLCLDAAREDVPRVVHTDIIPSHGPHVLVRGTRKRERSHTPMNAVLTPRRTPPRELYPNTTVKIPEVPPLSQTTSGTTTERLRTTRSPTPSQLSLHELERPASWDCNTAYGSPSPPLAPGKAAKHMQAVRELEQLPPGFIHHEV